MKKPRLAKKFLEEITQVPNLSVVCQKLNLSRQSVYRWLQEDYEFKNEFDTAMNHGRDGITDLAESKLISNINKGSMRAIECWLTNNDKRYYKPKKPMEAPKREHGNITINVNLTKKKAATLTGTVDSKSLMGTPPANQQESQTTSDLKDSETSTPNKIQDNSTSP